MFRRYLLSLALAFGLALLAQGAAAATTVIDSYRYGAGGGGPPPSPCDGLGGVEASTVFDLDATCSSSYGGSGQTWSSLEGSPADGASVSDYAFYLGPTSSATTADPTFTGTAGDAAAYFLLDGGDYFTLASGTNTAFLNALHKTSGADFWIAIAFQVVDAGSTKCLFALNNTTAGIGVRIQLSSSETPVLNQQGDTSGTSSSPGSGLAAGDKLLIISHSHSSNETRFWANTTSNVQTSHTFNASTSDASNRAAIGAGAAGSTPMPSGTRIYSAAAGNVYLDDTGAAALFSALNTRHGRTYAFLDVLRPDTRFAMAPVLFVAVLPERRRRVA